MAQKVAFQIVADNEKAQQMLEAFFNNAARGGQKAAKDLEGTKNAIEGMAESAQKFGKQLFRMVAGGGAIGAVIGGIRLIAAEWDEVKRKRMAALGVQVPVAQARARALENLPEGVAAGDLEQMVDRVSKQAGIKTETSWRMMSNLLSAKGAATMEQVEAAAVGAGRIARRTGEEPTERAGAILDLMKLTGAQSADEVLGWSTQIKKASRVTEAEKFYDQVIGKMASLSQLGMAPEQAAEEVAFFSQAMVEKEGAKSGTAAVAFWKKIMQGEVVPGMKHGRRVWGRTDEGLSPQERLAQVQAAYAAGDEDTRAEMLKRVGARAAAAGTVKSLLAGEQRLMGERRYVQGAVSRPGAETAALQAQLLEDIDKSEVQRTADIQARFEQTAERLQLENVAGGRWAAVRRGVEDVLSTREDVPAIARKSILAQFAARTEIGDQEAEEAGIDILRRQQGRYQARTVRRTRAVQGGMVSATADVANPDYNPELAAILGELIQVLERNASATEKSAGIAERDVTQRQIGGATAPPTGTEATSG